MKLEIKKLFLMVFLAAACISCQNGNKRSAENNISNTGSEAVISFEKQVHDFRQIIAGEKVAYAFRFTNTGNAPLLITGIRSGCGCTVGDYPKDPIQPGDQGRISVVFNSAGRRGFQSESVSVLNNSDQSPVTLRVTAEVIQQ